MKKKATYKIGIDEKLLEAIESTNENYKKIEELLKLNYAILSKLLRGRGRKCDASQSQ